jgi:hypothetical protein
MPVSDILIPPYHARPVIWPAGPRTGAAMGTPVPRRLIRVRPGNLYIREDRILPHLPALYLLVTGAEPAAGRQRRRTRHGADVVNRPASGEDVIGYLRVRQVTLTYHPATRTLQADSPGDATAVIGLAS